MAGFYQKYVGSYVGFPYNSIVYQLTRNCNTLQQKFDFQQKLPKFKKNRRDNFSKAGHRLLPVIGRPDPHLVAGPAGDGQLPPVIGCPVGEKIRKEAAVQLKYPPSGTMDTTVPSGKLPMALVLLQETASAPGYWLEKVPSAVEN